MKWLKRNEKYIRLLILISISCFAYYRIAYEIQQTDFFDLLINYSLAFISFAALYQKFKSNRKLLLSLSLLFRLVFIFSLPALSQDIYRFIWDGHLLINGYNPYTSTPDELMQNAQLPFALADELSPKLTELSAANHSNYPPLSQLFYAIAAWIAPKSIFGSIFFLRLVLLTADIWVYFIAKPILQHFQLPENRVFLYLLNPLLIVEGVGNLHFEPLMAVLFLAGIWYWLKQKNASAGLFMGLSIATKLLPLLLLPFLARSHKIYDLRAFFKKDFLKLSLIALTVSLLTFLPLINTQSLIDYGQTVGLWLNRFEFNASIYYVLRWLGYQITGWNMIAYFGKGLAILSIFILIFMAFRSTANRKKQLQAMMWALVIYFLLATTVHPWYLILPLSMVIFNDKNYAVLIWSFTIIMSYHAYQVDGFQENPYWLLAEYVPVSFALFYGKNLLQFFNTEKSTGNS